MCKINFNNRPQEGNVVLSPENPLPRNGNQFWVKATRSFVSSRGCEINVDDLILIDPDRTPIENDLILRGQTLMPYAGMQYNGVAIRHIGEIARRLADIPMASLALPAPRQRGREQAKKRPEEIGIGRICVIYQKEGKECRSPWFSSRDRALLARKALSLRFPDAAVFFAPEATDWRFGDDIQGRQKRSITEPAHVGELPRAFMASVIDA